MPWVPEFFGAVELARRQTRTAGLADPVGQYFTALNKGDTHVLETVWPGEVTVYDPRAGEIRGHRQLRRFVLQNQAFLAERHARTQTVAATCVAGRAVVQLLVHLDADGRELAWPVAVVAESPTDVSVVFRTYCRRWPLDGRRYVRPPILDPRHVQLRDVVGRYQAALEAGDAEAAVETFAADGYFREAIGSHPPTAAPPSSARSSHGASAQAEESASSTCPVTDDGLRCALEYNCIRWGSHNLTPQAGLVVD